MGKWSRVWTPPGCLDFSAGCMTSGKSHSLQAPPFSPLWSGHETKTLGSSCATVTNSSEHSWLTKEIKVYFLLVSHVHSRLACALPLGRDWRSSSYSEGCWW